MNDGGCKSLQLLVCLANGGACRAYDPELPSRTCYSQRNGTKRRRPGSELKAFLRGGGGGTWRASDLLRDAFCSLLVNLQSEGSSVLQHVRVSCDITAGDIWRSNVLLS